MITISESFVAPHPVQPVFDLVVDFGRIADWDPNVASSRLRAPETSWHPSSVPEGAVIDSIDSGEPSVASAEQSV